MALNSSPNTDAKAWLDRRPPRGGVGPLRRRAFLRVLDAGMRARYRPGPAIGCRLAGGLVDPAASSSRPPRQGGQPATSSIRCERHGRISTEARDPSARPRVRARSAARRSGRRGRPAGRGRTCRPVRCPSVRCTSFRCPSFRCPSVRCRSVRCPRDPRRLSWFAGAAPRSRGEPLGSADLIHRGRLVIAGAGAAGCGGGVGRGRSRWVG